MKEININTSEYILETSRSFSIYVCEQRAIPQLSDGLKSSQRKMLWVVRNKREKIKTISLAGEAISEGLYLHGDQSAAQTISLLASPYTNNIPLLTGIGSFGSLIDPYSFGAPRYTYVKKNIFTEKILYADLDIVPLVENYDGSNLEPKHFLPLIPVVLLNGISGIAVGWSTEILPRSANDIIDSVLCVLENKDVPNIEPRYEYLDINYKKVDNNTWEFIGKIEKKDSSTVIVKSLPPELTLEKFKEKLDSLEEDGKIQGYIDNSAENIDVIVKFKRGSIASWTEEKIIDFLKLRTRKTERIVVIDFDGNTIKQYEDVRELIKDWVNWRLKYYVKRYEKLLNEYKDELEFWYGVKICFERDFLNGLKNCKNKSDILKYMKSFLSNIKEKNLEKIVNLPTYKWNEEYYEESKKSIDIIENKIKECENILKDENNIKQIFSKELLELKKIISNNKINRS